MGNFAPEILGMARQTKHRYDSIKQYGRLPRSLAARTSSPAHVVSPVVLFDSPVGVHCETNVRPTLELLIL